MFTGKTYIWVILILNATLSRVLYFCQINIFQIIITYNSTEATLPISIQL